MFFKTVVGSSSSNIYKKSGKKFREVKSKSECMGHTARGSRPQ